MKNYIASTKKRNMGSMKENATKKLAEQILIEARKIAKLELKTSAEQILTDATSIARWEKNPFYIA